MGKQATVIPRDDIHREGRNYGSRKEGPLTVACGPGSPDALWAMPASGWAAGWMRPYHTSLAGNSAGMEC